MTTQDVSSKLLARIKKLEKKAEDYAERLASLTNVDKRLQNQIDFLQKQLKRISEKGNDCMQQPDSDALVKSIYELEEVIKKIQYQASKLAAQARSLHKLDNKVQIKSHLIDLSSDNMSIELNIHDLLNADKIVDKEIERLIEKINKKA